METSFFSSNIFGKSPLEMALSGGSAAYDYMQPSRDISSQIAQAVAANQQLQGVTDQAAYALANPAVISSPGTVTTPAVTAARGPSTSPDTYALSSPGTMYAGGTQGFDESMGTMRTAQGVTPGGTTGTSATTTGTSAGTAFPYTAQQRAEMANQAAMLNPNVQADLSAGASTGSTRGQTVSTAAQDQAAIDKAANEAQAKYNAELQANVFTKPQYGSNITFDKRYPSSWGVVTGSLEDRIFRQFGDLTGRYTSSQISPDEVKAIADKVRAGTIKEADVGSAITAAEQARKTTTAQATQQPTTAVESYFKSPLTSSKLDEIAAGAKYTVGNNIIKSGQVGVQLNDSGQPAELVYYDPKGQIYTRSAFLPKEFLKYANQFNINPTDLLGVEKGLQANKIAYKPYEIYGGTGSDHGFDVRDFLTGGMGTAYDWTKDPGAAGKGPTGLSSLKEAQDIASKFGLKYNEDKYKGGGIDPNRLTQVQGGNSPNLPFAVFAGDKAMSFATRAEAEAAAAQYGGKVLDLSGTKLTDFDNPNNLTIDSKGNVVLKPGGAEGGLLESGSFKSPLAESLKNLPARMPGLAAVR